MQSKSNVHILIVAVRVDEVTATVEVVRDELSWKKSVGFLEEHAGTFVVSLISCFCIFNNAHFKVRLYILCMLKQN